VMGQVGWTGRCGRGKERGRARKKQWAAPCHESSLKTTKQDEAVSAGAESAACLLHQTCS